MSHSPQNAERAWDVGLRDQDVVAFIKVWPNGTAGAPNYFDIGGLRASFGTARQGKPKSASEGAEVDLEWPSWCPSTGGVVTEVTLEKMKIFKDDQKAYTYTLGSKHAYASAGDVFVAGECILAGTVPKKSDLLAWSNHVWDAVAALRSGNALDRFAAAKAIPYLELGNVGVDALLSRLAQEVEPRVKLEIAAALAKLDQESGFAELSEAVLRPAEPYLRMEAVLIAAEVSGEKARDLLLTVATSADFRGQEVRQAAVWGLGESGCASYDDLIPFLADADTDVALHAMCAFASPLSPAVGLTLVGLALHGPAREQAAAREVLRRCAGPIEMGADTSLHRYRRVNSADSAV